MQKILILYFFFVSFAFADSPRKIGILLGGGRGETDKLYGFFRHQGEEFTEKLSAKNYEISGAFGPQLVIKANRSNKESFKEVIKLGKIKPATPDSIDERLDWLIQEIKDEKISKGDQVVIQLSTHGSPKGLSEFAHSIILPNPKNVQNTDPDIEPKPEDIIYPLSAKLNEVLDALDKIGAKTAVLDFSCFSGGTIDLAKNRPNVCAISSTNRFRPAFVGGYWGEDAASYFWNAVHEAKEENHDLESIFLRSRKINPFEGDMPEISSDEHYRLRKIWDLIFGKYASAENEPNRSEYISSILACSEIGSSLPMKDYKIFETLILETLKSDKDITELNIIAERLKKLAQIRDKTFPYLNQDLGTVQLDGYEPVKLVFGICNEYYEENGSIVSLKDKYISPLNKKIKESTFSLNECPPPLRAIV